jgi:hypothetical protein
MTIIKRKNNLKVSLKNHNKVKFVGKKYFLVNSDDYYENLVNNFFKTKKKK